MRCDYEEIDLGRLVQDHAPLVQRIAWHMAGRLPSNVSMDDLFQNGMLGLFDSAARYQAGMGAEFETFVSRRIRGSMFDGLRTDDWAPRSVRQSMRRVEAAIVTLEHHLGRAPLEREIADELDVSLAEYQQMLSDAQGCQIAYLEDLGDEEGEGFLDRQVADYESDPAVLFEENQMRSRLIDAIEHLPEREQEAMGLYYDDELNMREIGEVMGVTESRVCQLHNQAIARLRAKVFDDASMIQRRRGRPPKNPSHKSHQGELPGLFHKSDRH